MLDGCYVRPSLHRCIAGSTRIANRVHGDHHVRDHVPRQSIISESVDKGVRDVTRDSLAPRDAAWSKYEVMDGHRRCVGEGKWNELD